MSSSFRFGMGLEGEICWGPSPCFLAASKEFFQPCLLADFKEQMFLCFFLLQMPINRQATYQIKSFQSQVFFCNPIEREPRELKRGEKNRE